MSSSLFQIRNKYHEIEGSYTKQEILQRIYAGQYSGEEEIAAPPLHSLAENCLTPALL